MDKRDLLLGALAAADGEVYSPVQVQKLLFLLERKIPQRIGGPLFNFQPYDYGPFDKEVYRVLEVLSSEGSVCIADSAQGDWKEYRTSPVGQKQGEQILENLPPRIAEYFRQLSKWVRKLSFRQLVSIVYEAYPEMRANSVFWS